MRSFRLGLAVLWLASLARAQAPEVNPGGVVNAASYSSAGVAPGSAVSIFGSNLASGSAVANAIPLPNTLSDVISVTFNGVPAPLFSVSPLQINAQLPWNVLPAGTNSGTVGVVVTRSTGSSASQGVQVVAALPGIFTITQNGLGQAIATDNADGAIAAPAGSILGPQPAPHPIQIGDYLVLWCTGLGPVNAPITNGENTGGLIVNTMATPAVLIGGVLQKFIYSVLSPQFVSENQVAVQVVSGTPTGDAEPVQIQINGTTTSDKVTIAVAEGSTTPAAFHYLNLSGTFAHFLPDTTTLPGIPTYDFSSTGVRPEVGYQGGDFVNGMAIYPPWQVQPLGPGGIQAGRPIGVLLAYTPAKGSFNDNSPNPPQWQWYDMQSNPAYSSACPSANPGRDGVYCPVGYNSGIVVGNHYYLVPDAVNQYPVFTEIDTTAAGGIASADAYSFVTADSSTFGSAGWATGVYDGKYIYYAPTVTNGNIVRHDTTQDTNGLSANGWTHFDPSTSCDGNTYPLLQSAYGYLSSAWDGHRYSYFVSSRTSVLIRYDTSGASGAFDSCTAYTALDMSTLKQAGKPALLGDGLAQNLRGFGGSLVGLAGDTNNGTQYLYLIPWTSSRSSESVTLSSTCARVQVGEYNNGTWSPTDITDAGTTWEAFDLSSLTSNVAWGANNLGPASFPSTALQGQSVVAGFQLGWINTHNPQQLVGFGAGDAKVWVLHNPSKALNDPTGWTVVPVDPTMGNQNFGGPYDAIHQQFYPSSPFATELVQITGL